MQRLDYLPPDYGLLLGSSAALTRDAPMRLSGAGWRTDPVSGHVFGLAPVPLTRLRYGRGFDPKAPWARSSFQWAARVAAAQAADREAFALWADLLSDWAGSNPPGRGINWLSPMECARRAMSLILASSFWWQHLVADQGLCDWLAGLLLMHAGFVAANPEVRPGGLTTNHTSANHCGLLACASAIPHYRLSAEWKARAADGLEGCIARQARWDGMSFEGSVPYHFYALDIFAHGALLMKKAGIDPSRRYLDLLGGMFRFLFDVADSRGGIPQLGDDDSGEWVTPRCAYMPAMMTTLHRAIFGSAPAPRAAASSRPVSGVASLRTGGVEAVLAAIPVGQDGLGGHNHEDLLQLCLTIRGNPVLIDPGSGSYNRDLAARSLLRSMESHNGPVPDGAPHYYSFPVGAPFDLAGAARFETFLEASAKAGGAAAGARIEIGGRTISRSVTVTEGSVEVSDSASSGGVTVRLTLDPRWTIGPGGANNIRLFSEGEELEIETDASFRIERGPCSPKYDTVVETAVLSMHSRTPGGLKFRIGPWVPGRQR